MNKLHLVSILDRSGSMGGTESEVIGAYNGFIKEQLVSLADKGIESTASLILFDNKVEEVYLKTPLHEVPELTSDVYFVRGMTALYDAVGTTIAKFEGEENVIFFIETDGAENGSHEYTGDSLKAVVEAKKAAGWEFIFAGADLPYDMVHQMQATLGASASVVFAKTAQGYADRSMLFSGSTVAYAASKGL